ncbi:MAG: hypothetical protein ACRCZB_05275 [Bacteroidales bacterium]
MSYTEKFVIKSWCDFLKTSTKTREKIISDFQKSIESLDKVVLEQRQATSILLKKALNLSDGDLLKIKEDGTFSIEKGGNMEKKEQITLNGKVITKEELEKQKEMATTQKGAKLVEVSKNNYTLHLKG